MALTKTSTGGYNDQSVTTAKLANTAVGTDQIAHGAVVGLKLADQAVTLDKLPHGDSNNDGKFLRANNGADPSFETVDLSNYLSITGGSMSGKLNAFGGIEVGAYDEIIFDTDNSNAYKIMFKGPLTLTKDSTYTLPEDGTSGQYLKTDGSGVLSFGTVDLTALSASNLTSGTVPDARFPATLPAVSGANLTNLPASGKVTNLVLNGAMTLAQRGTSSTSSGYQTLDRFPVFINGCDENPTISQADIASGTTPYTLGFRKSLKITNGDQTTAPGGNDYIWIQNKIEAQDIANSGWNYTSSSSYITLSFWVKSSVAQTFKGYIETMDGTALQYPFETGSLSADTWTKITKTIPGHANLQFDNDANEGFKISIIPMMGTDKTSSAVTEDAWSTYSSAARVKDVTTTWFTTNDATFEITGVLLEVGDSASDFPHESYNETLLKCKRYCHVVSTAGYSPLGIGFQYYSGTIFIPYGPIDMRTTPTMVAKAGTSGAYIHQISLDSKTKQKYAMFNMAGDNTDAGQAVRCSVHFHSLSNSEPFVYLDAEL